MITIDQLKKKGFKVKIRHYRFPYQHIEAENLPAKFPILYKLQPESEIHGEARFPRGGRTEMIVTTPQGRDIHLSADCSLKDGFNKKRGVSICLERLFVSLLEHA